MKLRHLGAAACALLALGLAGAAAAQTSAATPPPAAPAPAVKVDPRAEALVRRYLAAVHFERTLDAMQAAMLPIISDQQRGSGLSAEDRQAVLDIVRKVMREKMVPQMMDRMVPIYAATFTLPELEALVQFYESPLGRSITDKIPSLGPKSAEITRALMPEMQREVIREALARFCPNGKCDAARLPKPAPS